MFWYIFFLILALILLFWSIKRKERKWLKINDYLGVVTKTVNSVRYGNLATKIKELEPSSYNNLTESINRMIETLNDREKMVIEYQTELARQNKFLEATVNSLSDGILIIDENYKILRATPMITKWFDEDGKKIMNKNLMDYIQTLDKKPIEKICEEPIKIRNLPSSFFIAKTMKLSLEDKKKRFVMIIKDLTDQKKLEKLKEEFVAMLTHDLKVPIVAESNILDFLISGKFGKVNETQFEAISNMKTCNQELIDLVQLLLEKVQVLFQLYEIF